MILGGMGSALFVLNWDAQKSSVLGACPVFWAGVLGWLRLRQPGLNMASGMLAGALVAGATVAGWCRPGLLLPEIPVISWLNAPAEAQAAGRPFMDLAHFILWLMMGTVGALLGGLIFRPRLGPGQPLLPILDVPPPELPVTGPFAAEIWKQPQ